MKDPVPWHQLPVNTGSMVLPGGSEAPTAASLCSDSCCHRAAVSRRSFTLCATFGGRSNSSGVSGRSAVGGTRSSGGAVMPACRGVSASCLTGAASPATCRGISFALLSVGSAVAAAIARRRAPAERFWQHFVGGPVHRANHRCGSKRHLQRRRTTMWQTVAEGVVLMLLAPHIVATSVIVQSLK